VDSQTPGPEAPEDAPLATPPTAPAVVAVVVARDPGPWFEETLGSIADQDYPNLSILVIDANCAEPVKPRVGSAAPGAFVRRLEEDPGFGTAANDVLEVVQGAAFYLFCHDDIALDPSVVRFLVEEGYRSNAAVVGPKLVDWDDPRRLLQVGQGMDRLGYGVPLVERGELDQSQHDSVRDVFTVPGPCTLIRADLFSEIGGFDEGISDFLDDVSLCWRAQIAGARVIVAPEARVRHRDVLAEGRGHDERRRLQARHRLRLVLSCYGPLWLGWAVLQTAALNVVEIVYAAVAARRRRAGDIVSAWTWNLGRLGEVRAARRQVRAFRHVSDREVRHAMTRGSARVSQFFRGQIGRGEDRLSGFARSGRNAAGAFRRGSLRASACVWIAVMIVLAAGSRHLLTRGVPAVGEMVGFGPPLDLLRSWTSGWRIAGLGSTSPAPTALGLIGALGLAVGGLTGALRTLLTLGMLPLGALFAYRLPAPTGSRWAQIVCLLVYITVPLPYDALAAGHWGTLVLYAAAPALVGGLARASLLAPFGPVGGEPGPGVRRYHWFVQIGALGLATAVVASIVPVAVLIVVAMASAMVVGGLLAMNLAGSLRLLGAAAGASVLAVILHLPWSLDFLLPGTPLSDITGVPRAARLSDLGALLRFDVGPIGSSPIGWSFLAAAALPLLIGRAERHAWAVRGWTVAVVFFAAAWASQRGSIPVALPPVDLLLVPAAAGLALAAGMGVSAFEVDLPGYRFGWRQVASGLSAAAVLVGILPVVAASFDGRWRMPAGDDARALGFIDSENDAAPFRVLWIGDPDALPLAGWELDDGLAYATTDDGLPTLENLLVGSDDGRTGLLGDAVNLARTGQTARLGRLLAPMGIRYVIVPEGLAPAPFAAATLPVPDELVATLEAQLDLAPIDTAAGLRVYRNDAFLPVRAALPAGVDVPMNHGTAESLTTDLSSTPAVLPHKDGRLHWSGAVVGGTTVLLSAAHSDDWELLIDGTRARSLKPFGWAIGFEIPKDGEATLRFRTPTLRYGTLALQALAWLVVLWVVLRQRRRGAGDGRRAAA
jgi:GT2 family glycosyltransferase